MPRKRVIPVLLYQKNGLYKSTRFENPVYVGDPMNAVKIFNEKFTDELIFIDTEASKLKKEPDYELIQRITGECFMPLSYGGGITNCQQIEKIIRSGNEKIILGSSALFNPEFVREATRNFGTSTVVVCMDIKKNWLGAYMMYSHTKSKITDIKAIDFIRLIEDMGAGEIMINDVVKDGTLSGYDEILIQQMSSRVKIPVIACGGASSTDDFKKAFSRGASAVAAGSLFIFRGKHKAVLINYPEPEEIDAL